ncbi:G-type lectin S-receptor-like serine/threonine-protein kinase B120 [Camellia lanceoleosa]|uniref:G-type lectin S-receptor-like serine/threonine-protein kinase B120 n=1 Tax=Camellia lanceoleosa TaxID=1840588 RepID=A0ACC0ICT8_9ERIC|nr:G-type lectin S-receptor-like serine/threonine-protein kinase B120 [Camellia lanceoleosa]
MFSPAEMETKVLHFRFTWIEHSTRTMKRCSVVLHWLAVSCWLFFPLGVSSLADTLGAGQEMKDWEHLESSNVQFQLGFFSSPSGSTNRYLGILAQEFYYPNETYEVVWVANAANPLTDSSGVLKITQEGTLMINDSRGISITLNSEKYLGMPSINNMSARLDDSGNFVLRSSGGNILWQSFDHPSNVWLQDMKLGLFDLKSGKPQHRFLTSWSSLEDPDTGDFTLGVDEHQNNTKQLVVWKRGVVYWSSGFWNGYNFNLLSEHDLSYDLSNFSLNFSYFSNENESYFTYNSFYQSNVWFRLDSSGVLYLCHYSSCDKVVVNCNPDQGDTVSTGCVMPKPSKCIDGDVFEETRQLMKPYLYLPNSSLGLSDCKEICRTNCSCEAYASLNPSDGSGCIFYQGLYQGPKYTWSNASVLYVRNNTLAGSVNNKPLHYARRRKLWLTIVASTASLLILASSSLLCYIKWRYRCFKGGSNKDEIVQGMQLLMNELNNSATSIDELSNVGKLKLTGQKDRELPFVSFSTIEIATEYFSERNMIGQGGYGHVYKGLLVNGQGIAVKRLSGCSRQGLEEFKNEVTLISRLQHRNLVRLLGYCMQRDERILIYEYLPNKSLNFFLFDVTKQHLLDWKVRVSIIGGIAQGLLYLHNYSRVRIIHRDLKTSNILLDKDMNPKISDFGTARIFGDNENQAKTKRIVGTLGYMSPEYAMDGLFSVKSDVFSFGVMMLEIISGKRNTGFYLPDGALNLLGYAWNLWKEAKGLELVGQGLVETCSIREAMRYIQVGLLCVQEIAADRPNMLDVVSMLTSETIVLPFPNKPAFSKIMGITDTSMIRILEHCSINNVTNSEVEVR